MLFTLKFKSSQKEIDLTRKKKNLGKLSNLETSSLPPSYSVNFSKVLLEGLIFWSEIYVLLYWFCYALF